MDDFDLYAGTAHLLDEVDKKLMVSLRDGCVLVGILRSVDQFGNLVLHRTVERIHVGNKYGDIPRGVMIVRGRNIALLGEIDAKKEAELSLIEVSAFEILNAKRLEDEKRKEKKKLISKALKKRGLRADGNIKEDID